MRILIKLLKYAAIFIGILIVLVLVLGLIAPKHYSVTKSTVINKQSSKVYDYVYKLKNQNEYGVWYKRDPNMKQVFSGNDGTVGFKTEWESKTEGSGSQEITAIEPGKSLSTVMIFKSPMGDMKSDSKFEVVAKDSTTSIVNWTMSGTSPYPFNAMNLFISIDDAVGKDFEGGLANMKKIIEAK